jgi:hypothetical protein
VLRDRACGRPCGALRVPLPALVECCAGVTDSLHPGGCEDGLRTPTPSPSRVGAPIHPSRITVIDYGATQRGLACPRRGVPPAAAIRLAPSRGPRQARAG